MGVMRVAVADGERLFGDLFRGAPGGVGLVGEDADRRVAWVVALQHSGGPVVLVAGDVVPDRECATKALCCIPGLAGRDLEGCPWV